MDFDVAIIGGGASGIGAGRVLQAAGVSFTIVEARSRLGGRGWTVTAPDGGPIDLGCEWLHSADRNPMRELAESMGRTINRGPAPWQRRTVTSNFPVERQDALNEAREKLDAALEELLRSGHPDRSVADLHEPGSSLNGLMNAVSSYMSGAEADRISAIDLANYADSGVNWRIAEGYGDTIVAAGAGLPVLFDAPVTCLHHDGARLKLDTTSGKIEADRAIVTLPTDLIAAEAMRFSPALPDKVAAAAGLPLGVNEKLFLTLDEPDLLEPSTRAFGRTDSAATAVYALRPDGRPIIEAYFGGTLAETLDREGEDAFFAFAREELGNVFGARLANSVRPAGMHRWRDDPFTRGGYSYAVPGSASCRQTLAVPVDDRIFFAGEACSTHDYSTVHGAWRMGIAAADAVLASLGKRGARAG